MCRDCTEYQEAVVEYIDMLDRCSLRRYKSISNFHTDQELLDPVFVQLLTAKRSSMTEVQRSRKPDVKTTGMTWLYPMKVEKAYQAWITRQMKEYTAIAMPAVLNHMERWVKEYQFEATPLLLDQYEDETQALIAMLLAKQEEMFVTNGVDMEREIAGFAAQTSTFNEKQFEKFQKVSIGTTFKVGEPWINATVNTWVKNNKSLLKGMTDEYIKKLQFNIADGFQDGLTSSSIIKNIRKMDTNMTATRARLLGRDQIGKLNGVYTKNRSQQAGLAFYVWLTAGDERVRKSHKKMNGTTNKWSDTSVYSTDGGETFTSRPGEMQGATPGSQIQCRCTSKPAFKELMGQIDDKLKEEEI